MANETQFEKVRQKLTCRDRGGRDWEAQGQTGPTSRRYLQQKTEKFHLLSSPDASTKSDRKRHTDGKESCENWNVHPLSGTCKSCIVLDIMTYKLKTSHSSPAWWCLQADLWEFKAKLTYKVSSQPARAAQWGLALKQNTKNKILKFVYTKSYSWMLALANEWQDLSLNEIERDANTEKCSGFRLRDDKWGPCARKCAAHRNSTSLLGTLTLTVQDQVNGNAWTKVQVERHLANPTSGVTKQLKWAKHGALCWLRREGPQWQVSLNFILWDSAFPSFVWLALQNPNHTVLSLFKYTFLNVPKKLTSHCGC